MGCDIHLYVERRTDSGWEHVPDHSKEWGDPANWFNGRNYDLFSILADVRNGTGFAGVKTGDGFRPIDTPRGLPVDVSLVVRESAEEWGVDGHSHSHLTVAEILAYDWDQETVKTGLFKDNDRERFPDGGRAEWVQDFADRYKELPSNVGEWCADVFGPSANQYKRVTWTTAYHRCVSGDWWASVARAARLSKGALSDVRFVFWFDN
jgi:hypothetical protein